MYLRHIRPGSIEWQDAVGWQESGQAGAVSVADDDGEGDARVAALPEGGAVFAPNVGLMAAFHPS